MSLDHEIRSALFGVVDAMDPGQEWERFRPRLQRQRHRRRMMAAGALAVVAAVGSVVLGMDRSDDPKVQTGPVSPDTTLDRTPDTSSTTSSTIEDAVPGPPISADEAERWEVLPIGIGPLNAAVLAFEWTGDRLVLVTARDGWVFDIAGHREDVGPPPISLPDGSLSVWTGREVIIWGGGGAAVDVASGTWRRLPQSPLVPALPVGVVWTGEEMVVFGSRPQNDQPAGAAAYDPDTDSWRSLPDPPVDLDIGNAVWTGAEVVAVGTDQLGDNRPASAQAVAMALDPVTDTWRTLPDTGLNPQAPWVAWTGRLLVAWDYGGGEHPMTATHAIGDQAWSDPIPTPLDARECYPAGTAAGDVVLLIYCGDAASRDPATGEWVITGPPGYRGISGEGQLTEVATTNEAGTIFVLVAADEGPVIASYR